jgi:hypothetical protein
MKLSSRHSMVLSAVLTALVMSGCVVAPPAVRTVYVGPPVVRPVYVAPPNVVYIAPAYAIPGQGYEWRYHDRYGWGWYHPANGWHRGWR